MRNTFLKTFGTTVTAIAVATTAIIGCVTIFQWLNSDRPRLDALHESFSGVRGIPGQTRDFLSLLSEIRDSASETNATTTNPLSEVAAEIKRKATHPILDDRDRDLLIEGTRILTGNPRETPDFSYSDVHTVTLRNVGNNPAKDIDIGFAEAGFFEVWGTPGHYPEQEGIVRGTVRLPVLAPDDHKHIFFWPKRDTPLDDPPITITSGEGRVRNRLEGDRREIDADLWILTVRPIVLIGIVVGVLSLVAVFGRKAFLVGMERGRQRESTAR